MRGSFAECYEHALLDAETSSYGLDENVHKETLVGLRSEHLNAVVSQSPHACTICSPSEVLAVGIVWA